jgi:DNA mismatch endonuclease (patch repair protein)
VQVQGCFWHAHEACPLFRLPDTRREFWERKLLGNRQRDERNRQALLDGGWRVATVWECALRAGDSTPLRRLERWLRSDRGTVLDLRG